MAESWNSNHNGSDFNNDSNMAWNATAANVASNDDWNSAGNEQAQSFDFANPDFQDEGGQANNDGLCRRCQQPGHIARECTEPRTDIACHNCGGPHMAKECDQPRAKSCRLCKGQHDTIDCKTPYPIDLSDVPDLAEEQCWQMLKQASDDADIDDFKDAMKALQKACPEITYPAMEKQLRSRNNKFYLIGLEKEIGEGYTNVNIQGEAGQKFAVTVFKSANCPRPNMVSKWPKDAEENLSRLSEAGVTLTRGLDHCRRCEKYGHTVKDCSEERVEVEGMKVVCALCSEEGHRVRDCTQPRQKPPRTCKRCGNEGHIAKDCDQPEPVQTCRNCGEEGHISKDCERTFCRNCDKEGHISKDCTEPKDWSRVVCKHCGEKGHASASRCKPGAQLKENGAANIEPAATNDFRSVSNGDSKENTWETDAGKTMWNAGNNVPVGSQW